MSKAEIQKIEKLEICILCEHGAGTNSNVIIILGRKVLGLTRDRVPFNIEIRELIILEVFF